MEILLLIYLNVNMKVNKSLKKTKNKIDLGEGFTFSENEKFILLSTIIEQK